MNQMATGILMNLKIASSSQQFTDHIRIVVLHTLVVIFTKEKNPFQGSFSIACLRALLSTARGIFNVHQLCRHLGLVSRNEFIACIFDTLRIKLHEDPNIIVLMFRVTNFMLNLVSKIYKIIWTFRKYELLILFLIKTWLFIFNIHTCTFYLRWNRITINIVIKWNIWIIIMKCRIILFIGRTYTAHFLWQK